MWVDFDGPEPLDFQRKSCRGLTMEPGANSLWRSVMPLMITKRA